MPSILSRNKTLSIAVKKYGKKISKFLVLSSLTGFLYFVSNILFRVVGFYQLHKITKAATVGAL